MPVLSRMNTIQTLASYVSKTPFNIVLPSTSRSSKRSLSFRFSLQNPVWVSLLPDAYGSYTCDILCRILAVSAASKNVKLLLRQFWTERKTTRRTLEICQGVPRGGRVFKPPPHPHPAKFRSFDKVEPDWKLSGKCLVFLFQHPD
jgi:hypothetical protein